MRLNLQTVLVRPCDLNWGSIDDELVSLVAELR
jgi:hypothetical protein